MHTRCGESYDAEPSPPVKTVVGFPELHHGRREHQLEGARNFRIQGFT
jgi:hypothetical protein